MSIDWNIVLGIIGSIAVPLFIALVIQARKKSFSYSINNTPIFSIHQKIDGVEVTFHKKPVKDLRLIIVKLWNSGNVPIKKQDFEAPINICPTYTARGNSLIDAQIIDKPEGAIAKLINDEEKHHFVNITLAPMLFNPGDSIALKIIIANYGGDNPQVNIKGHIEGVKKIIKDTENKFTSTKTMLLGILLTLVLEFLLITIIIYSFDITDGSMLKNTLIFNATAFSIIFLIITVVILATYNISKASFMQLKN